MSNQDIVSADQARKLSQAGEENFESRFQRKERKRVAREILRATRKGHCFCEVSPISAFLGRELVKKGYTILSLPVNSPVESHMIDWGISVPKNASTKKVSPKKADNAPSH